MASKKARFVSRPRITISTNDTISSSSSGTIDSERSLSSSNNSSIPNDVINGEEARRHEFPWVIRLGTSVNDILVTHCGGSIISPNYAITAAHCVKGWFYTQTFCLVGVHSLSAFKEGRQGMRVNIKKIIVHEDYEETSEGPVNDIALLKLDTTLNLGKPDVDAIKLPSKGKMFDGEFGMLAGWGLTRSNPDVRPDTLMKKRLKLWPRNDCNNRIKKKIVFEKDSLLCVSDEAGAHCFGDSGGPLMIKNSNGVYELAGLVSFGPIRESMEDLCLCENPCKSGYYVNVAYHLDWIKQHTTDERYLWGDESLNFNTDSKK